VYIAAGHPERRVVRADGLFIRPLEQAVNLAVGVVVQLDLADSELICPGVAGVVSDLRDRLRGQFEVRMEVHELRHLALLALVNSWESPRFVQRNQNHYPERSGPALSAKRSIAATDELVVGQRWRGSLDSLRGQPVDAFPGAAGPRAAGGAYLPAGTAPDGPLDLAALPLVPRHQLVFQGDHTQQPAAPEQQELALAHFWSNRFHKRIISGSGTWRTARKAVKRADVFTVPAPAGYVAQPQVVNLIADVP
jgi:hypothetical protein